MAWSATKRSIGIGVAAVIMCGAMAGASQAFAQQDYDYWFIGNDDTAADYVDADSIVSIDGDVQRALTWYFYSNDDPKFSGSHHSDLVEVNCRARQMHLLRRIVYDSRGGHEWSQDTTDPWDDVVAGSFGEGELEFICSSAMLRLLSWTRLSQGETPEQHAQQFFGAPENPEGAPLVAGVNR
jgi:hypothetical protein